MKQGNKKMVQLSLYDEIDIKVHTVAGPTFTAHNHFLFEIIYVLKGSGVHIVNSDTLDYCTDEIFILTPDVVQQFEIKEETIVCTISFNEAFFSPDKSYVNREVDFSEIFKKLEVIYYDSCQQQPRIMFDKEKELVRSIIQQLIAEKEIKPVFYYVFVQNLTFLFLSLLARKLQSNSIKANTPGSTAHLVLDVINYIEYHIYDKKKITLGHLARAFGRSKESLLRYFKSATGKTVKEFITEYKLTLIKSRLLFSEITVSAIAEELGLTDESHLNKMFKSKMKITPNKFRELYKK